MRIREILVVGYSYFGLIDDVVDRFPFEFEVDNDRLNFELTTQLIDGKPLLLNDGYLVLHPICRQSIQDKNGLLWDLLTRGFITVLHRGGADYRLDEMPEVMAPKIDTYNDLINDRLPGFISWKKYKDILKDIHEKLYDTKSYRQWPKYKTESGFIKLSTMLLDNGINTDLAKMNGVCLSDTILTDFINEFVESFNSSRSGPRNYWEILAKKYSEQEIITTKPNEFFNQIMSLANELYHYNFGVMLCAQEEMPISVETRNSNCFNFLLETKEYLIAEDVKIPKLSVPQSILSASSSEVAKIYDAHRNIGQLRTEWLELKFNYQMGSNIAWEDVTKAGSEYSKEISSLLGSEVDFGFREDLFGHVIGKMTGEVRGEIVGVSSALAGSVLGTLGGIPGYGAAVGYTVGYGLAKVHKHYASKYTDRIKVHILNKKLLKGLNEKNKKRLDTNIPSSFTIDKKVAAELILQYETL